MSNFWGRCEVKLGIVIGNVVSTKKVENINSLKILVVSYLNDSLEDTGKTTACIDTVSAGEGDVVLLCASSSARQTKLTKNTCTDNIIVGIVDFISCDSKYVYRKSKSGCC